MRLFSLWRMLLVFQLKLAFIYERHKAMPHNTVFHISKLLNVPNRAASVYFPAEVWARGQKVSEDTGQVPSEKEQQRTRPLEIYVTRGVSMTEWINADRVPTVKDRGILESISRALFCSRCLRLISTVTCSETCQVRLTQRDVSGPRSVPLCRLSGQFTCFDQAHSSHWGHGGHVLWVLSGSFLIF